MGRTYQRNGRKTIGGLVSRGVLSIYENCKSVTGNATSPLDGTVGARVYGNTSGLSRNLVGDLMERKARSSANFDASARTPDPEISRYATELREQGYTKLGRIFSPDIIQDVQSQYLSLLDDPSKTVVDDLHEREDDEVYQRTLANPGEDFTAARTFVSETVRDVLRAYYRSYMQVRTLTAYRTWHIPEETVENTEVYNNYWHYDGKTTDHIKLFICLTDTDEDDGPLHVVPKPGMRKIADKYPNFDRYEHGKPNDLVEQLADPVTLTGKAGTAMLANTQSSLHRAGVPEEGQDRDLLQFYIAPSGMPLPSDWFEQDLDGTVHDPLVRAFSY